MPQRRWSSRGATAARIALVAVALFVAFLIVPGALPAQSPATKEIHPPETVFSLIMKGRWIMIPMGICSLITITLAIERAISWRKSRIGSVQLVDEIFEALPLRGRATKENLAQAMSICDASSSIVGRVLRTGLERFHRDEAHAQASLEETAAREARLLKRKVRAFSVISALSPLLGLLGTISGMIQCFEKATSADSGSRVSTLTQGIYEALVATATGLLIAIVALVLYHYFLGIVDRIVDRIDEAGSKFLEHYYGNPIAVRTRTPGPTRDGAPMRDDAAPREEAGRAAAAAGGPPMLEAGA